MSERNGSSRDMEQTWLALGALLGFAAVAFGAFGAHALQSRLSVDSLSIFETGVRYQMYHALALFGVAYASHRWGGGFITAAGVLFIAGVLLFSGSLYALALSGVRILGAVTPFGGLAFLAGWLCLALGPFRS